MFGPLQLSSTCFYLILLSATAYSKALPAGKERSDSSFHDEGPGPPLGLSTGFLWSAHFFTVLGGLICLSSTFILCVCCRRKPRESFRELQGATQLSNISNEDVNTGEIMLFPPPSLVLSDEDFNVCFEPLPAGPQKNSLFHTYRPKELEEWIESGFGLFPRSNIQYLREIGKGWFGQVLEAEIKGLNAPQSVSRCAVKILRPEANTLFQARFVKDAEPLRLLNHPNVLKLIGCCLESPPLLILLQHCPNGDLKLFLQSYQEQGNCRMPLPENVLLRFACEAAQGLLCWHQAGLVHEDVAARSFMLTGDLTVVLGSYGLSLHSHEMEFIQIGQNSVPIRWIAPELYDCEKGAIAHTKASNVWSFGVVLWEIICLGTRPYGMLSDEEVVQQVLQEKRTILTAPAGQLRTEQVLYQLMLQCWDIDVNLRPSMEDIVYRLTAASVTVSRDLEQDFELKWNSARSNQLAQSPTASLNNLHGSYEDLARNRRLSVNSENEDTDNGFSAKVSAALRSLDEALAAVGDTEEAALPLPHFRLGSSVNQQSVETSSSGSSLTSSKSWQERIAGGELEALVREKSRSVQDLMVLTHVEPLSDVEFLLRDQEKGREAKIAVPQIRINSVQESTNQNPAAESEQIESSPQSQYSRLRLTSTPCSDDESKQCSQFSPQSLDTSIFQQPGASNRDQEESSVILGPSDELGLGFYQALTTTQTDRLFDEEEEDEDTSKEENSFQVNIEAWNRFLDEACEQQHAEQQPVDESREVTSGPGLKDSGIARPSFSGSVDILGSTFDKSSVDNSVQVLNIPGNVDNLEENAEASELCGRVEKSVPQQLGDGIDAALATEPQCDVVQSNRSSRQARSEIVSKLFQEPDYEDLESSRASQSGPLETYYSYGKIDEDIRPSDPIDPDETPGITGKSILAELQMKNRIQRQADQLLSSSDSGSDDEDQEEVLVVDLETKRAVLVEAQSPKLKTALANEDFDAIFNTAVNGNSSQSSAEPGDEIYTPDFESESENGAEEESSDEGEEGIEQSSFVWQAAYCRKIQPSLSMEIIEEECEDEEEDNGETDFVPSTWRKDATPTRSALKSPDKSQQRKNVSWMKPGRKVYSYTVEDTDDSSVTSVPSPRRKWNTAPNTEVSYASFADWDFALDDEPISDIQQSRNDGDIPEDMPAFRPKPKDLVSGSHFYRLSDIGDENDEEDEFYVDEKQDPLWTKGMNLSQFQPSQYFSTWDKGLNKDSSLAHNGNTQDSADTLLLELPDSRSSNSQA